MSLASTTSKTRRILFIVVIVVIAIIAVDTTLKFLASSSNPFSVKPSFYVTADTRLGTIPVPNLLPKNPITLSSESNPTFIVEGAFPTTPDTARVYTINAPALKLTTVEDAITTATNLGFNGSAYTQVDSDNLSWQNTQHTRTLKFNEITKTWQLITQYFQDVEALKSKTVHTDSDYIGSIQAAINTLGFSDNTLSTPSVSVKYAKLNNNGLFTNPVNISGADYVEVSVYRTLQLTSIIPKSSLPDSLKSLTYPNDIIAKVYKNDPRYGSLNVIASNAANPKSDIFQLDFTAFEYSGVYTMRKIITPAEAWSNVSIGKGALVLLQLQTDDYFANSIQDAKVTKFAVDAKNTQLAYFEPTTWDGWAYPIYVFKGRAELSDGKTANFTFYVDALRRIS